MPGKSFTSEQILAMLAEGPARIAELTDGVAPVKLHAAPGSGEWSANEVLAHLRSCADVWGDCIRKIVAETRPTFRAVNPTTWIKQTDHPEVPFQESMRAFTAQRADLVTFLEALPREAWSRAAIVTGAGKPNERTVMFYAQWLARHERTHFKQIARAAGTEQR